MAMLGEDAVVLGASMGGLLAAGALSPFYRRVIVLDRYELPDGVQGATRGSAGRTTRSSRARAAVPGRRALEELFPGLLAELESGGAPVRRCPYPALRSPTQRPESPRCTARRISLTSPNSGSRPGPKPPQPQRNNGGPPAKTPQQLHDENPRLISTAHVHPSAHLPYGAAPWPIQSLAYR
jgi:hypothetical protein